MAIGFSEEEEITLTIMDVGEGREKKWGENDVVG